MSKRLLSILVFLATISVVWAQAPMLEKENPKDYTTHVVGYAHIDMAWLWRWEESVYDIMFHTFNNQLNLMDEACPFRSRNHYILWSCLTATSRA